MVSVKVFVSTLVVMVLVIVLIVVFSPGETDDSVSFVSDNQTVVKEPVVQESSGDSAYLIGKCDVSIDECKGELEGAVSGATFEVMDKQYFSNFSFGNAFFEENKGDRQESLRRELSSFNSGDVDSLFPVVLYLVSLSGSGGTSDLVVVCNSFGDLEMTSRNWLFC